MPRGEMTYLADSDGTVLVVHERDVVNQNDLLENTISTLIEIKNVHLPVGYKAIKQIAIGNDQGIYYIANAHFVQSSESTVTFYLENIDEHMLELNEHYKWSQPLIVEMKSFDLANEFSEIFVRGIEVELLKMFRRISKELIVQLDYPRISNSSKVERFIVGDKTFDLHQDKLVYEGFAIVIEDRPVYEIFEQVTMIIGNLTFE